MKRIVNEKPQKITHAIIWDEGCNDPIKFFANEKKAKEFIKELDERPNVTSGSIKLAVISSIKSITIKKSLGFSDYKI